jgi:archaellum component FlaC
MEIEQIEQRIKDIKNELHSLDHLRDAYDDTNIHEIDNQIDTLITERESLITLLESSFDKLIGL